MTRAYLFQQRVKSPVVPSLFEVRELVHTDVSDALRGRGDEHRAQPYHPVFPVAGTPARTHEPDLHPHGRAEPAAERLLRPAEYRRELLPRRPHEQTGHRPVRRLFVAVGRGDRYLPLRKHGAGDGATIDILRDVTQDSQDDLYNTAEGGIWLLIGKSKHSLTINGNGHTLTMTTAAYALYINSNTDGGNEANADKFVINDLKIVSTTQSIQQNEAGNKVNTGIVLWHGGVNLTLNNVTIDMTGSGVERAIALRVAGNGVGTTIDMNGGALRTPQKSGYAFAANNPVRFTAEDTEFSGWAAVYMLGNSATDGSACLGTSGSVVTLKNTKLYGYGKYPDGDNNFGVIVLNDGGITVNVIGGSVNLAPAEGAMMQSIVYYSTFRGADPSTSKVTFTDTDVTLTGSNTVFVWGNFNQNAGGDVTVAGGTFNFAVTENYLAEGYAPLLQAGGTYAVVDREDAVAAGRAVAALATTDIYGREVQALYSTLQAAVNAAKEGDTVTLLANVNESIEIAQGQEIVLDLNGKTLTNAAGSHTVTNYGTLTIVGNGTVTNTTDEKAAVFNEGTAYLNGGTYTRTADGTWYVIANNGAMEMRGITVRNENVNDPSSLVQNNLDASKDDPATLTIYSGNYACAGGNVIMNNDYGVLTIEDGTFVAHNYTDKENYQVVQNYATATINGGTFTADAVAIAASAYDGQSSSTTINGGTFTAGSHGSAAALYFFDYDGNSSVNVTITGGEFNGTYAIRTYKDSTADDTMSIQGGTFEGDIAMGDMTGFIEGGMFKQQPAAEYMDPGYAAEYRDGFYVPVESSALYIAQKEARADIRMYAASLGIAWSDVVAAADPENASPYQAKAELVMNAYNAIAAAASEKQVADARLAAMDVVEIYAAFVVEAEELEAAKTNAEADVRAYAANYGILWAELEGMAEAETLVGWSAQAVLDEYAKIDAAASEKQVADAKLEAMGALDVLYDAIKGDAMTDIAAWLNEYLGEILGTAGDAGSGVAVVRAFTAETTAGDIYAKLAQAFSEDNAKLVLKYYNDALAAIDAATTVSEVTTAVSTFKAQVASVEAAAQNVTDVDLTGVYVLLAILVVAVAVVIVVMILKRRQQPAQQAAVQEAAPVQAQAAPEPVTREVAVTDDDKEQVVIAANVRSFSEAYVDLSQELRELFNKVRAYALGKENAVEVRQSTGVCVKRNGKQIVKLTVRRNAPVALFFLENEMLKDFRRESGSQSKLKVHATELILREEADLAAAYKMVDLSIEQIDKDIAAKKERAKELRRLRRQQKAEQSKKDGAES